MERVTFSDWEPAEEIENREDIIAYLETAFEDDDPEFLQRTIAHIVRSKVMAQLIEDSNIELAGLYTHSSIGDLSFTTVVKILNNLGFRISIQQKKAS